jgi:hypothetical protein
MGVITNLIRLNEEKKQNDFEKQLGVWKELAGLPNASDELKQIAVSNLANLTGEKLGLPKKAHGAWGQLLAGLSGLNPVPKDQYGPRMQQLPQAGPATEGQQAQGGPVPGGQLPGAPAYRFKPTLTDEEMSQRAARATGMQAQAQYGAQQEAVEAAKQKDIQTRLALLEQNKDLLSPQEYQDAKTRIISGGTVTRGGAAALPKPGWAKVSDGKGGTKVVSGWLDVAGQRFVDENGNEVDPATIVDKGTGKQPTPPVAGQNTQLAQLQKARDILANPGKYTPGEVQGARDYIANYAAGLRNRQLNSVRTGLTIDADRENLYGDTGGGTGSTGVGTGAGGTGTGTGSGKGKSTGKATDGSTGPLRNKDGTPNAANPHVMSDIDFAKDYILGTFKGGRSQFTQARAQRGLSYLHNLYNVSPEALQAAMQERKGVGDALVKNTERYAAFTRLDNELQNMGKLLQDARARVPDYNAFLNKLANHIRQNYTGDKDTAELVVAANGFGRVYTTLVGGGWVSNAMPHVQSETDAREAIANFMTGGQIDGVIEQVGRESDAVRGALVKTGQDLVTQQQAPLGTEATAMGGGGTGGSAGSGKGGPAPKTAAEFLKKHGG